LKSWKQWQAAPPFNPHAEFIACLNQLKEYTDNRGVSQIRKWLPDVGLANVRFHPGPHRSLEVEQAGGRTDKNGQFVLAIDGSQHSPDELFGQAQLAEENGNIAEAERLYCILMKSDPTDASALFNLGNLLRAAARNVRACMCFFVWRSERAGPTTSSLMCVNRQVWNLPHRPSKQRFGNACGGKLAPCSNDKDPIWLSSSNW
jgi:hypothetical protein